jgi:signal transduction histidine kinase
MSSGVLYSAFSARLEKRFHPRVEILEIQFRPIETANTFPSPDDVREDLVNLLLLVNGFLLLIAGALSYKLAEWTLAPLKKTFERERRFLGDASHELRTPISILKMDMENELMNSRLSDTQKKKVLSNLEEVNRMGGLVNDLLTVSRLADDGAALTRVLRPLNVSELIRKTVSRLDLMAKEQNVTMSTSLPEADSTLKTDEALLDAAITNCVKNAITYNKPNGTVKITLIPGDSECTIMIADTGIGMTKPDSEKIFERFFRIDRSRSRKTGGSGLGLSIVKSAVKELGGRVTLTSEPNIGTTIAIVLPRNPL